MENGIMSCNLWSLCLPRHMNYFVLDNKFHISLGQTRQWQNTFQNQYTCKDKSDNVQGLTIVFSFGMYACYSKFNHKQYYHRTSFNKYGCSVYWLKLVTVSVSWITNHFYTWKCVNNTLRSYKSWLWMYAMKQNS